MFIKGSVFKKLLKEAYVGCGLRAGQTDDGIYTISGGYWTLEVARRCGPVLEKYCGRDDLMVETPMSPASGT